MNTTNRTKLHSAIFCAFGAAAVLGLTSIAGADIQTPLSKTVKFDDLNISTPAGAKVLYGRIQTAAVEVCPQTIPSDLHTWAMQRACVDHAIDTAVKSVNSPALTELRFGSPIRLASK
ncbi:MAG: UrcA family protein [Steroidobacteraceae bacterium]